MFISFFCPHCNSKLEIGAHAVGTQVPCPQCGQTVTIPRKPLGPGVTVGNFKIKRLLGRGAMGEVYLARQVSMDRDVALKILPPRLTRNREVVESFLQEVRLQARLEHPNIVTAHEAGEDEGVYYLAMAYVGESLAEKLQREGPLTERAALEMTHKLAKALAYAWDEHQLLHRDIKPGNIVIDSHGDPRLTDLGLSKSLRDAGVTGVNDLVAGTPNYMSPEQANPDMEIDFRADMYSLGSTLYHMLVGQLPWGGMEVDEILRRQATEALPDPRDFNPAISDACVELLALMLAKNRDHRHPSWGALIGDIERVMAGEHPSKKPLAPGESAILRVRALGGAHEEHKKIVLRHSQIWRLRRRATGGETGAPGIPWLGLAAGMIAVLLALGGAARWLMRRAHPPAPPPVAAAHTPAAVTAAPRPAAVADAEPRLTALEKMYAEAVRYGQTHSDDYAGTLKWFEQVQTAGAGTEYEIRAAGEIRRLTIAQRQAAAAVLDRLRAEAEELVRAGRGAEAAGRALAYAGPLAAETLADRQALAEEFTRCAEDLRRAAEARQAAAAARLAELRGAVAADLLRLDCTGAVARVAAAAADAQLEPVAAEREELRQLTEAIAGWPRIILDSFQANQGVELAVAFKTGSQTLEIMGVSADKVRAGRKVGTAGLVQRNFGVEDLSVEEQLSRLGREPAPALDIVRGLLNFQIQRPVTADRYFRRAGGPLGDELAQLVNRRLLDAQAREAALAFSGLMRLAGLPPDAAVTGAVVRIVRRTGYPPADATRIREAATKFRQTYGGSEIAQRASALLAALEGADTTPREIDPAVLAAAVRRVQEANPQAGNLSSLYDVNDEGIELDLSSNPELSDITPLRGLPLTKLNLAKTRVRELEPLRRMPLRFLNLSDCPVDDIGALEGMPLEELNLSNCRVKNMRPLKDAPLNTLMLPNNPVDIVGVLADLPLKKLDLSGCMIEDFRPLRHMPLEWLSLWKTRLADLKPLKGLPLKWLNVGGTRVADLSPLDGMPLQTLVISVTPVADLTPLKSLPLKELAADHCGNIKSIAPLAGMPLTSLYLAHTGVGDLAPIRGMPLQLLNMTGAPIMSFAPFKGMTTLAVVNWDVWDQFRMMTPIRDEIQAGNYAAAAKAAGEVAMALEMVPAFARFNAAVKKLANEWLPAWSAAAWRPSATDSLARSFGGHRYLLHPAFKDMKSAQAFCVGQGAQLAAIGSPEEMEWVKANFALPGIPVRLGGTDAGREGVWTWLSGEPWGYTNWVKGQPDDWQGAEDSLMFMLDGSWHDIGVDFACPFLMEWAEGAKP